jgi:hypothetical protein
MAEGQVRYKMILFGDDYVGTIMDESSPYTDPKTGKKYKKYLIVPHLDLVKAYTDLQKPLALPVNTSQGKALWVSYPYEMVSDKNPSRGNAICRVDCGFDGRATWQTERRQDLLDEIATVRAQLNSAIVNNITLKDMLMTMSSQMNVLAKNYKELKEIMEGEKSGTGEEGINTNKEPMGPPV